MCVTPTVLKSGQQVACRKCWQCIENRIGDWVGRCIAEKYTAKAAHSITLTYGGGDHVRAAVLTYSDVQRFLKLLRRHGYPCRYMAVGEYGSTKGRAHWHLLLYWLGEIPSHKVGSNFTFKYWPHGHTFWDKVTAPSIRYVCKYIQKDTKELEKQGHFAVSKKPPIGAEYFIQRAHSYVAQGLSPRDAFYTFPSEEKHTYMLRGRVLDIFCEAYVARWREVHPGTWWPHSDLIEAYEDRQVSLGAYWRPSPFIQRRSAPFLPPPDGAGEVLFSEPHNAYYCVADGRRLWWSHSIDGEPSWESVIRTARGDPAARIQRSVYRRISGR